MLSMSNALTETTKNIIEVPTYLCVSYTLYFFVASKNNRNYRGLDTIFVKYNIKFPRVTYNINIY